MSWVIGLVVVVGTVADEKYLYVDLVIGRV